MIKISSLEKFLSSSSATQNSWATSLYLLATSLQGLDGVEVVGVAPDFDDWYACFYLSLPSEKIQLSRIRSALQLTGACRADCRVVKRAGEFGKKSGYRRVVLRISERNAVHLATLLTPTPTAVVAIAS